MIRKKLFVSIAGGLAALTLAAGLGMFPVSASTAYDTLIDDDFEASEELNAENWNALAEEGGASLSVTAKSILSYDLYHGNSIATKEKVTVADTDCLLIEFDLESIDVDEGFWAITYGSATTDLKASAEAQGFNFYGDSSMFYGTSCTFPTYSAEGNVSVRWLGWKRKAKTQIYIHPDGSQELYQGHELIAYVKAEDATKAMKERNGHLGISFIGADDTKHVVSTMNYFKAGTFTDTLFEKEAEGYPGHFVAAPSEVTWILDDSVPAKAGLSDLFVTAQTKNNVGGWITKNNYVEIAEKAGSLVSKKNVPEADGRIREMFSLKATLGSTGLSTATAKMSFGNAAAGIAFEDDKYYLTVWNGAAVAAEKEVALGEGMVRVKGYGDKTLEITYNGVTVSAPVDSFGGAFSFDVGAGAVAVKLDDVILIAATGFEHKGGASAAVDFSGAADENDWYIGSAGMPDYDGSGVSVKDGRLIFRNAQDGSMISTVRDYQNFVFSFDIVYLEREGEEDDDGNIVRPRSTWLGMVYGAEEKDTGFGSESMVYFGSGTLDLLNTKYEDGSTRKWLTADQDIFALKYVGKTISVRLEACDGTVRISWYLKETDAELGEAVLYDQNTFGHVSVQCTQGGNFEIDNVMIVNTDEVAEYALTKKVLEKTELSAALSQTKTGAIDLGDMKDKTAMFALVQPVEGFEMRADGSYTYTAPSALPEGKILVAYTVEIDDWNLLGYSPAGSASKYTLNGTIEITVTAPVLTGIEITEPTKTFYVIGEELDLSGLTVKAVYDDGHKAVLGEGENGYTADKSAYRKEAAGTYTIKITYGEFEKSFVVTVAAKQDSSSDTRDSSGASGSVSGGGTSVSAGCNSSGCKSLTIGSGVMLMLSAVGACMIFKKNKKD